MEALPREIQLMVFEHAFSDRTIDINEAGRSSNTYIEDLFISKTIYHASRQAYLNASLWSFPSVGACDKFIARFPCIPKFLRNIKVDIAQDYDNLAIITRLTSAGSILQSVTVTGCTVSEFGLEINAPDVRTMAALIGSLCSAAGTLDVLSDRPCETTKILDRAELYSHHVVQALGAVKSLRIARVHIDECEPCELLGLECGHAAFENQIEAAVMARVRDQQSKA